MTGFSSQDLKRRENASTTNLWDEISLLVEVFKFQA